jgi:hypothetical protein
VSLTARWWVKGQEHVETTKKKNQAEAEVEKDRSTGVG